MTIELEDLIGARLVIGFPGTTLTPETVQQFKETRAGGIILYRINFESPAQLKKLIKDLEEALQRKLLVCVDHEGGRVVMYGEGVTVFPDNLALGHTNEVDLAKKEGEIAARELRALGTDVNFAPVLDVLTDAYSPNIGIRSYGKDWNLVAEMGAAYITALQKGGVSATAKHFPGKGHAPVDAHLSLPTIPSTWEEMKKVHLQPFIRAIQARVDVIMSSHPRYPNLDPKPGVIATFSRHIVHNTLRGELGFRGVISSDDLEMGAITEMGPIDEAAVKAAEAGHDLLLSCHDFMSQKKVFRGLLQAYKGNRLSVRDLEESADRIESLKRKRKDRFSGSIGPERDGPPAALAIARKGCRVLQDPDKILPLSKGNRDAVGIVFPRISSFAEKIMIEKEFLDETSALHRMLGKLPGQHAVETYAIHPTSEDMDNAGSLAKRSTITVFFCFDAHLYPSQQDLLKILQNTSRKLAVVFLRDPYDRAYLTSKNAGLTAFGFRRCQIQAALERIYGES